MTSHRIGVNLRVSGNCDQGARKYMEDNHVIKFLKKDTDDYEFAYFGIFDGHGGPDASAYCRDNLLNEITKYDGFWSNDDAQVLSAIRKGFLDTHNAMWNVIDSWPKTVTGLPSTAGSTATVAIIKQGKLYTGHVGDSALVLGENDPYGDRDHAVQAICMTKEHKPDDPDERLRIEDAGGEVINKSGVPRVVWSRPKTNHKGPVRRSTHMDQIPFLAVARSLGDLWSYDYFTETYVVSPEPDVACLTLDATRHRCLILASDGLWNMLTPEESVNMVMDLERQFEEKIVTDPNVAVSFWSNPAERLVARALNKWRSKSLKADNTSCVVVLVDPLGPSKLTLLKRKRQELFSAGEAGTSGASHSKIAKLQTTESELRNSSRMPANRNANCSLSDSHIRVTDDSIIIPHSDKGSRMSAAQRQVSDGENKQDLAEESINDSVQYFAKPTAPSVKRSLRHSSENRQNVSLNIITGRSEGALPQGSQAIASQSFSQESTIEKRRGAQSFTKILQRQDMSRAGNNHLQYRSMYGDQTVDLETLSDVQEEQESDEGSEVPDPPPGTPCSGEHSDSENTLHSSADVTDTAFSLASDESLGTPVRSLRASHKPRTPQSAPSKLSSAYPRKSHLSRSAKRKLARQSNLSTKPPSASPAKQSAVSSKSCSAKTKSSSTSSEKDSASFSTTSAVETKTSWAEGVSNQRSVNNKDNVSKAIGTSTKETSTSPLQSPVRRVLNTSRSMNNVGTPLGQQVSAKFRSCTGLTPSMGQLTANDKFQEVLQVGTVKVKTLKPSNKILEENGIPSHITLDTSQTSEPLKQLNKTTGGGKRWGNFLRSSKLSLEHIFHSNKHSHGGKGLNTTTSTGKLEPGPPSTKATKTTSVSASRLPSSSLSLEQHLPDITLSHYANFSALSVDSADEADYDDDSMLSLRDVDLAKAHHSLLEDGVTGGNGQHGGKKSKGQSRGFLQKTRVTLKRARKAAKKAFFPENQRDLKSKDTGVIVGKRRSDEFLPRPDTKRRRQLEA